MAAAATCFSRLSLSLPVLLSPPTLHRFLASSSPQLPSLLSLRRSGQLRSLRLHNIRSFSADASADPVGGVESVPVGVAHKLLNTGHRYLDVRTPEEFKGGHPVGATNIPYMFRSLTGMRKNPEFLEEVSSTFEKNDQIIVGCHSGKRSLMAAIDLASAHLDKKCKSSWIE